jgi:hypothetical protein
MATALSLLYHLPRRSGRSPASSYPPSRRIDFIKIAEARQEDFVGIAQNREFWSRNDFTSNPM